MLTGAKTEETEYRTRYLPVYENEGLNAVFSVYAAENREPDGTIYYEQGQKVDEIEQKLN